MSFLKNLLNILYPRRCIVCQACLKSGSIEELLCLECWNRIKRNSPPLCRYCGRQLKETGLKEVCSSCEGNQYYFDRAYAACAYEGVLKELIHQFKYNGKSHLQRLLGRLLREYLEDYGLAIKDFDFIMPVPLHKRKLREREFNQAALLAEELAADCGLKCLNQGLLRIRDTVSQTELPKEKRLNNVKDCFVVNPGLKLKERSVLIVDDLLTTGATCSQAAMALKNAGAKRIFVLALAN